MPAHPAPGTVFLHIGKTGGTALRALLRAHVQATGQRPFRVLPHRLTLTQAAARYPRAGLAFFIRDPLERLVSGFLSRQRRGRPRFDVPWSQAEARAFARFPTPDALGRALAEGAPEAEAALAAIQHTRDGLAHFLGSPATLEGLAPRITFIGRIERFEADIARLKRCFAIAPDLMPPADPVGAHRNPHASAGALSAPARAALTGWLADDYRVHRWCCAHPQ